MQHRPEIFLMGIPHTQELRAATANPAPCATHEGYRRVNGPDFLYVGGLSGNAEFVTDTDQPICRTAQPLIIDRMHIKRYFPQNFRSMLPLVFYTSRQQDERTRQDQ